MPSAIATVSAPPVTNGVTVHLHRATTARSLARYRKDARDSGANPDTLGRWGIYFCSKFRILLLQRTPDLLGQQILFPYFGGETWCWAARFELDPWLCLVKYPVVQDFCGVFLSRK
jgi:hypothetical protein